MTKPHQIPVNTPPSRVLVASVVLTLVGAVMALMVSPTVSADTPPRDFFGTVLSSDGDLLVVRTGELIVEVTATDATRIRLPLKRDASLSDLVEGDTVAVSLTGDDSSIADRIVVVPRKTQYRQFSGRVSAVSDSEITIVDLAGETDPISFNRTAATKVTSKGGSTELSVGMRVIVVAVRDAVSGQVVPDAIELIIVPGRARRSAEAAPEDEPSEAEATSDATISGVFNGVAENGDWIIGETRVEVRNSTRLARGFSVGQLVRVDATLTPSGVLVAREVTSEDKDQGVASKTRLTGVFEGTDSEGRWIVSGNAVTIATDTDTDGVPTPGQEVRITARRLDDGTLLAREVENRTGAQRAPRDAGVVNVVGTLREIDSDGNWRVNGAAFAVDENTTLKGEPRVGNRVRVRAVREADRLLAKVIAGIEQNTDRATRDVVIRGRISRIENGTLIVNGVLVKTGDITEVDGELADGRLVRIKAIVEADGSVSAKDVEVEAETAAAQARTAKRVDIEGIVEAINADGTLVVNGITIKPHPDAESKGEIVVGGSVRIVGVLGPDGVVIAGALKGENRAATPTATEVKVEGAIESLERSADETVVGLIVDGTAIRLRDLTDIKVRLRPGVQVTVQAVIIDGTVVARKVVQRRALQLAEPPSVTISGKIQRLRRNSAGEVTAILINRVVLQVVESTRVSGTLEVGVAVRITGVSRSGRFVAAVVRSAKGATDSDAEQSDTATDAAQEPREITVEGVVEAIVRNRDRQIVGLEIRGHKIAVNEDTEVSGIVRIGVRVTVTAEVVGRRVIATEVQGRTADSRISTGSTDSTSASN